MEPSVRKRKNRPKLISNGNAFAKIVEECEPPLDGDDKTAVNDTADRLEEETNRLNGKIEENAKDQHADDDNEAHSQTSTKVEAAIAASEQIAIPHTFRFSFEFDLISITLFLIALATRIYKLNEPNHIVFDELHYGKYVSLYLKRTFFFDQHPPLGKQLIAAVSYLAGFNGNYTFAQIGSEYSEEVPIFWMRFVPAVCGSLLVSIVYHILRQLKLKTGTCLLGGILIILENSLITQSRFMLMESMLLTFSLLAILLLLKYQENYEKYMESNTIVDRIEPIAWMFSYGVLSAVCFTCAVCIKFVGFYTCLLGLFIGCSQLWRSIGISTISDFAIILQTIFRALIFSVIPIAVYLLIYKVHLAVLNKAGPHDAIMTSAFQASLEGGLASITKGQPLNIAHGSQITLRHTHGRACWLHSHAHVYPVRYPDKRGSSHQQQITCYSFKDVHNWWIVKRPVKDDLVVDNAEIDVIKHGDEVQLIHGITSRALNSHDVAAAMSPQSQEVSCYIDYNISMPANILWKVDIVNRNREGDQWHTIKSHVRLIHVVTGAALRFSGRQLPEWGFNQHEIVADRAIDAMDAVWNVEEHRYTKTADQRERERQMVTAEMIPTKPTTLTFLEKFFELQSKMLWSQSSESAPTHMYSSTPLEWPLLSKGIAYWIDGKSNAQIHLIGNILIWYSGTLSIAIYASLLAIYLLRRRRQCYDIDEQTWTQFTRCGEILFVGYFMHFLPYFFVEKTLFLHNYLVALIFKIMLLCFIIEHFYTLIGKLLCSRSVIRYYCIVVCIWLVGVLLVFRWFIILTYGSLEINGRSVGADDIIPLRWKDTWDFILHKELS